MSSSMSGWMGMNWAMTGNPFDFSWIGKMSAEEALFMLSSMVVVTAIFCGVMTLLTRRKKKRRRIKKRRKVK